MPDRREVYNFRTMTLHLAREALLSADGAEAALRPKSFALLRFLIENAGVLLTRETIKDTVWPGINVVDDNITQCIAEIRAAVGDDAQQLIRTVRGRGYVFTGEVDRREEEIVSEERSRRQARSGIPSIGVLAFANASGDSGQDYLAAGFSEALITELARNRLLLVIAATSSFSYRHRAASVRQIATELDVRYLVEGCFQQAGAEARISVRLIDCETEGYVWAERFSVEVSDQFGLHDEIVDHVVRAMDPAISLNEQRRALRKPPGSLTAWEAWQRALWHWGRGESLAVRRRFLEGAVALDPSFAPAHAMLARLHLSEITQGKNVSFETSLDRAAAEASLALSLDPASAAAHAALAWVLDHRGDSGAALERADSAVAIGPNDPQGHLIKGHVLGMTGRHEDAHASLSNALRLDPLGPTAPAAMHNRAVAFYLSGDYAAAEATTRASVGAYPEHPRGYVWRAASLGQLGRSAEARAALELASAMAPSYLAYKTVRRAPYVRAQDHEHLLAGLRKAGWH